MKPIIEENSGYCFGVEYAIKMAEDFLTKHHHLYCLGDIVHNAVEVNRLKKLGLEIINYDQLKKMKNVCVLVRAHGEPPKTYRTIMRNNIKIIDASCPVVLKLQNRIKSDFDKMEKIEGQIVIYGKKGHAEVEGLYGQTANSSIIIADEGDLDQIDFSKPITFFSQTTKSINSFYRLKDLIKQRVKNAVGNEVISEYKHQNLNFKANDSICRQVSGREPLIRKFAKEKDIIIFVGGRKSSNGLSLFNACKEENNRSYFIENVEELDFNWFEKEDEVGICGATSTPRWLMEKTSDSIEEMF